MKYSITIDVVHATEWKLNPTQAVVYGWLSTTPFWANSIIIDNHSWYFASRNKCIEEVPFVPDKPDTIYRVYRQLIGKGLMLHQRIGKADYIMFTEKGKKWGTKQSIRNPEIIPGNNSTENFPTYNNYDKEIIPTKEDKELPPEQFQIKMAFKKCKAYFEEWDGYRQTILTKHKIDLPTFETHLMDWVRHKVDQPAVISNPTKHLHKTFEKWIERSKKFDKPVSKPGDTGSIYYDGDASKMQ